MRVYHQRGIGELDVSSVWTEITPDAAPSPVMLPQSSYTSRSCPPALRPPILA